MDPDLLNLDDLPGEARTLIEAASDVRGFTCKHKIELDPGQTACRTPRSALEGRQCIARRANAWRSAKPRRFVSALEGRLSALPRRPNGWRAAYHTRPRVAAFCSVRSSSRQPVLRATRAGTPKPTHLCMVPPTKILPSPARRSDTLRKHALDPAFAPPRGQC